MFVQWTRKWQSHKDENTKMFNVSLWHVLYMLRWDSQPSGYCGWLKINVYIYYRKEISHKWINFYVYDVSLFVNFNSNLLDHRLWYFYCIEKILNKQHSMLIYFIFFWYLVKWVHNIVFLLLKLSWHNIHWCSF